MTDILRDIGKIARALDAIANIEFKEYDLSKGQYLYLVRIFEQPGIIPDQLAELIKVDRSTAARALKKLAAKGLIEKRLDQVNKKIRRLFVTPKGAAVVPIIQSENAHSNQVALQHLSEEEIAVFASVLKQVVENIDDEWHLVKKGQRRPYLEMEGQR